VTEKTLTSKQQRVLDCIREYVYEYGYPPSVREICAQLGLNSPATVHMHIKSLSEMGYLQKDENKTRAITITNLPDEVSAMKVPILGVVAAGKPIYAEEDIEGYIAFDTSRYTNEVFALRVRGSSMVNAGIMENDVIIVGKQQTARSGEIVVAIVGEEATVKRLKIKEDEVLLMPENPQFQPLDGSRARIVGKVYAVVRTYQ